MPPPPITLRVLCYSVKTVDRIARSWVLSHPMTEPVVRAVEPGAGRTVLVVTAHADDVTLFIGGTVAAWTDAGWHVVVVRVTDDRWDSVGMTEAHTIAANAEQFRQATSILGVYEVVDLGYPTDTLGDASEVGLREHIIRLVRTHRPYALVTFDPFSMYGEDNQDHLVVAAATDESFWTSQFDLHHPEHILEGLEPHGCFERWYFGRDVQRVTDVIDIGAQLDRKLAAACAHRTMMLNYFNQLRLQARTGGWRLASVEEAIDHDDPGTLLRQLVAAGAKRTGARYGVGAAEAFRVVRFGGLGELLDSMGSRLP